MAKFRPKKERKKRAAKRRNILASEKSRFEKIQKTMLMNLIEEEKRKGLFDNSVQGMDIPKIKVDTPQSENISSFVQQGPVI
jgi:hypothetical protein